MGEPALKDIVAKALRDSHPHQQGLALDTISAFDWDQAEVRINQMQELPFRQEHDFRNLLSMKHEFLSHLKHFSLENALDIELDYQIERNLRPFVSCAYAVATKHIVVFEKAFANVYSPDIAQELVVVFEAWKDTLLECNHTFQDINLYTTIQHGERGLLDDYYHKDLFCLTLMQDKVHAILSEALTPFTISTPLYKGYDEQDYLYNAVLKPPSDELKNALKSFLQTQELLLRDRIDAGLPARVLQFHTQRDEFHTLFKQVYRDAQKHVEDAKEAISESISRLDHPRSELITRFECDITFHLDLGLPTPSAENPKIIAETVESILRAFEDWKDEDRQDEEAHAMAFAQEFDYQTMMTVLDTLNTSEYAGDAYPTDEEDEDNDDGDEAEALSSVDTGSDWQSGDDEESDDMDCD